MRGYIGVTDFDWYRRLLTLQPEPEEVNFWQPSGGTLTKLAPGSPFLFKLHKGKGDAICGFGLYARGTHLPIREAWNYLGASNGVSSLQELYARVVKYRAKKPGVTVTVNDAIGCHLILAPVFFERDMWIDAPSDWSSNIVQGAGRSLDDAEMSRIWRQCLERAKLVQLGSQTRLHLQEATDDFRYGEPRLVAPRLGQGIFRSAVLDAYGRACAVTTEHSVPVLEAAHVRPYGLGGTHDIRNGLLLRADVHKLFDAGYVTVTPDARFEVSTRLKTDFDNGVVYYAMHGKKILLPEDVSKRPDPEQLRWHNEKVFVAA
ncbi:MAG: HNH endonuclease [Myxococcales bacterium]|nr:HNH endonuclease [Myxococcales bacterium]